MRIGYGYDAHRLKKGRRFILCGVEIQSDFGPDGHSDADVATHALMDALLGAAALGDIGRYFPDSDERWRGADSIELLKTVNRMVNEKGFSLSNADITIVLEAPRLSLYIDQMRARLAGALAVGIDKISVKATTTEKMGFTGSGEGISSSAVVLLDE